MDSGSRQAFDDLPALVDLLWRRRKLLVVVAAACGVLGAAFSFLIPPAYTAKVSLLPQRQTKAAELIGQFTGQSASAYGAVSFEELYARIVKSDRVLDEAIARRWVTRAHPDSVTLFQFFGIRANGPDPRQDPAAVYRLKQALRTRVVEFTREKASGYMELRVTIGRDPQLAAALANFLVERLDAYNRLFRKAKASEQRTFVANRLEVVSGELTTAEKALAEYVSRNRAYASSPETRRLYDELAREVGAQTTVWTELRRQLELARIDENRELVSVDVLDRALPPTLRSRPHRSQFLVLGGFLGLVGAMAWVLARQQWRAWRTFGGAA
jgi:uncharacterized protein involved in exopolysaccharide biosynthesis